MSETETGDQGPEVEGPENRPEKTENICVICLNPDKPILNKRSQTCCGCYQLWRKGVKMHPTLGKFEVSQVHHKSKIKTAITKKIYVDPPKPKERSYPFPDVVPLDFSDYPDLKAIVFEVARLLLMPPEHIIITLVSEGIMARKKE